MISEMYLSEFNFSSLFYSWVIEENITTSPVEQAMQDFY